MAVLRFLSALFLLISLVALAADATPLLSGQIGFHPTSVHQRWTELAPAVLASSQQSFAAHGVGWIWNALIVPALSLPAFLLFGALALLFGYAGRRRRRINVFIN